METDLRALERRVQAQPADDEAWRMLAAARDRVGLRPDAYPIRTASSCWLDLGTGAERARRHAPVALGRRERPRAHELLPAPPPLDVACLLDLVPVERGVLLVGATPDGGTALVQLEAVADG